jgi:hypothetical protein
VPCAQAYWNGYQYFSLINDTSWQTKTLTCVAQTEMHVAVDCAAAGLLQPAAALEHQSSEVSLTSDGPNPTELESSKRQAHDRDGCVDESAATGTSVAAATAVGGGVVNRQEEDLSGAAYRAALSRRNSTSSSGSRTDEGEHSNCGASTSTRTTELALRRLPEHMLESNPAIWPRTSARNWLTLRWHCAVSSTCANSVCSKVKPQRHAGIRTRHTSS